MADSCLTLLKLEVGANPVIDASTTWSTDAQEISRSYEWSMKFIKTGTDANPILTIEVSNDNVNWSNPYAVIDELGNLVTPITFELVNAVTCAFDSILPFRYIRVSGVPNGTTTGTLEVQFVPVLDA